MISKKVAAKATQRNKLKRAVFNFFRLYIAKLPVKDYLVILHPPAAQAEKKEFLENLYKILNPKP